MWKTIPDTSGLYRINSDGNIKRGDKILRHILSRGYHYIFLCVNGKTKRKSVHRLVAELFLDNPQHKPHVNHKDGNKDNNTVSNLEWCTPSENQQHRYYILGKYTNPSKFSKSIKVKCINDNNIFNSIREACRYYNIDNSRVSKLLKAKDIVTVKNIVLEKLRKEK